MHGQDLPVALTPADRQHIERRLADVRERGGTGTIGVFSAGTRQVVIFAVRDGEIGGWCLMPARDQRRAHELEVLMDHFLKRELDITCRNVKALADAVINRAAKAA